MSESAGKGKKWLLYGCLGCGGLIVLLILVFAAIAFSASRAAGTEEVAERVLTRKLEGRAPAAPATDVPASGRVVLNLSHGEFEVVAARPGEPMRVEAVFDTKTYSLEESYDVADDASWTYRVGFKRTGSGVMAILKQVFGGTSPEAQVYLPPDVSFALELELHQCAGEIDLGGLALTEADIGFDQAGVMLEFSEPTPAPLDRFSVRGSMSGGAIEKLGNASPRRLDLDMSMGGVEFDLRGAWRNNSTITITGRRSGGHVQLPDDVRIEGLPGSVPDLSDAPEVDVPTLRFSVDVDKEKDWKFEH